MYNYYVRKIVFNDSKDIEKFIKDFEQGKYNISDLDRISEVSFIKLLRNNSKENAHKTYINFLKKIVFSVPVIMEYVENLVDGENFSVKDYEKVIEGLINYHYSWSNDSILKYLKKELNIIKCNKEQKCYDKKTVEVTNYDKVAKSIILKNPYEIRYASKDIRDDKKLVLSVVEKDGNMLNFASERLKNDEKVVLTAVNNDGYALKYASEEMKNNRKIVLSAVKTDGGALEYASEILKNDTWVVLAAIKNDANAIKFSSKDLRDNDLIAFLVLNRNGLLLEYLSDRLKDDKEIVLVAINSASGALEYASERLRNDKEIVSIAVENDCNALKYASISLLQDNKFLLSICISLGIDKFCFYMESILGLEKTEEISYLYNKYLEENKILSNLLKIKSKLIA